MFVFNMSSMRHHNKSYDYGNNDKHCQKPKKSEEMREKSVEAI